MVVRRVGMAAMWAGACLMLGARGVAAHAAEPGSAESAPVEAATCGEWSARVVELRPSRKSEVVTAILRNGVAVHYRRMALGEPAHGGGVTGTEVHAAVTVAINGAELLETEGTRGVSLLSVGILDSDDNADPGPGRPSADVDAAVLQDAFLVRIRGTPEDLESGLRWLAFTMEHPRLEVSTLERRRADAAMYLNSARMKRPTAISDAIVGVLHAEPDVRLHAPTSTQLARVDVAMATAWVREHAERAPIEVSVVGTIPLEGALRLVASTLGALPARSAPVAAVFAERRALKPAAAPMSLEREDASVAQVSGGGGGSLVMVGFRGCELGETTEHRTLRAVAAVLNLRVSARLSQSGVLPEQAVAFIARPALAYPTMGAVLATCRVDNAQAEAARGALVGVIDDLLEHPATLEELASATAPLAQAAAEFESDAPAWSTILARSRMRSVNPDGLVGGAAFYRALTPGDLTRALANFGAADRRFTVTMHAPGGGGAGELLPGEGPATRP